MRNGTKVVKGNDLGARGWRKPVVSHGKPDAGNPHVRLEEGAGVPCGDAPLYSTKPGRLKNLTEFAKAFAGAVVGTLDTPVDAKNLFSGEFLTRHGLSATSSVRSALKILQDKDLVYRTDDGYVVYDRIFGEWLRRK